MSLDTPNEPQVVEAATLPRWVTVLFVVAFALVAYLLYANYSQRVAQHNIRFLHLLKRLIQYNKIETLVPVLSQPRVYVLLKHT